MKKIHMIKKMGYEQVTELTKKIGEVSPVIGWSTEQKRQLVVAVNQKLLHGGRADGTIVKKSTQVCSTFELYLTESDWAKLNDVSLSDRALVSVMRHRCKSMGLHHATEPTKGRIAQIINTIAHNNEYHGQQWGKLLDLLKDSLKTLSKETWALEYIVQYPEDPRDLPTPIMDVAYADEGPAMRDIPGMDCPEFLRNKAASQGKHAAHVVEPRADGIDYDRMHALAPPAHARPSLQPQCPKLEHALPASPTCA